MTGILIHRHCLSYQHKIDYILELTPTSKRQNIAASYAPFACKTRARHVCDRISRCKQHVALQLFNAFFETTFCIAQTPSASLGGSCDNIQSPRSLFCCLHNCNCPRLRNFVECIILFIMHKSEDRFNYVYKVIVVPRKISKPRDFCVYIPIDLELSRHRFGIASKKPVKNQSDTIIQSTNFSTSRFHRIVR